jgi:hypothetical protein
MVVAPMQEKRKVSGGRIPAFEYLFNLATA